MNRQKLFVSTNLVNHVAPPPFRAGFCRSLKAGRNFAGRHRSLERLQFFAGSPLFPIPQNQQKDRQDGPEDGRLSQDEKPAETPADVSAPQALELPQGQAIGSSEGRVEVTHLAPAFQQPGEPIGAAQPVQKLDGREGEEIGMIGAEAAAGEIEAQ